MYDREDETWRFWVDENTGTILRGRLYDLRDFSDDTWMRYWGGCDDTMVAFYDGHAQYGVYALTDNEDTERAISAYRYSGWDGLQRLAPRLTDKQPEAAFIAVALDRGLELIVLSWNGDPEGKWRREIEAVWHGDVWRIETQEYQPGMGPGGSDWIDTDDLCDEAYGFDNAERWFEKEFPLDAFPADLMVTSGMGE